MGKDFITGKTQGVDYEYIDGVAGKAINALNTVSLVNAEYEMVLGSEFALSLWFNRKFDLFLSGGESNPSYSIQITGDLDFGGQTYLKVRSDSFYYTYSYSSYYSSYNYISYSSTTSEYTRQPSLLDGQLHHVVIQRIYENTEATTEFYLDGIKVDAPTNNALLMTGREEISEVLTLFLRGTTQNNVAIDQMRVYHRSLSAAEIAALNIETN